MDGELQVNITTRLISSGLFYDLEFTGYSLIVMRSVSLFYYYYYYHFFRMENCLQIVFQDRPQPKVRDADHLGRERVCLCGKAIS